MKKSKIAAIVAGVVALGALCCIASSHISKDMLEANVEALSDAEGFGFGPMCSQSATPGSYYMKLCINCNGSFGRYAMDYVAFCPAY